MNNPPNGLLTDHGDRTLTYTSDAGYTGPDSFLYTAGNGAGSDVAPISIEVRSTVASAQGIVMDTWTGISGNSTSTMTGLTNYPDSPDASELRTTFEAPTNRASDESGAMVTDTFTVTVDPDNDGDGLPDATDPDDDEDNIPDSWEIANGLDSLTSNAGNDADHDGFDDLSEYIYDTGASNANSKPAFLIEPNGAASTSIAVRFMTSANRRYVVEFRENLGSGNWQDLQAEFDGTGAEMTVTDPTTARRKFYRLRVSIP